MKNVKDKIAVITGAASGIGLGFARKCLQEGMKVVLADVDGGRLKVVAEELAAGSGSFITVRTNVIKPEDVEILAQKAFDTYGAVHVLFNNAGVGVGSYIHTATLQDWNWVLGVNLFGVIHGIHYFVPRMIAQREACHVINTASIMGLVNGPLEGPYRTSKAAIIMLSETLHCEQSILGTRIKVSVVCPGGVATKIVESEVNRPKDLENTSQPIMDAFTMQYFKEGAKNIAAGIDPKECADIIFHEAVEKGKFYIFPNAGQKVWMDAVQLRTQDMISRKAPTIPFQDPDAFREALKRG